MTKFLTGKLIVDTIQTSLSATERADFAVAYWGQGATKTLGLDKTSKPARILCDLSRLSCNPDELQKLLNHGHKLKTKGGLHSKVYITSDNIVVGSANASTNGLGELEDEIDLELEAAVMTSDSVAMQEAIEWFERHWAEADTVDKNLLDQIRPLWKSRSVW